MEKIEYVIMNEIPDYKELLGKISSLVRRQMPFIPMQDIQSAVDEAINTHFSIWKASSRGMSVQRYLICYCPYSAMGILTKERWRNDGRNRKRQFPVLIDDLSPTSGHVLKASYPDTSLDFFDMLKYLFPSILKRRIICMYYFNRYNDREIADKLSYTRSYICRLRNAAIKQLSSYIKGLQN